MPRYDLHDRISKADLAGTLACLSLGANPNAPGPDGLLPLQSASLPSNSGPLVRALLCAGADPRMAAPGLGVDLLAWACRESHWAGACAIAAAHPGMITKAHCDSLDRHGASIAMGAAALGDLAALRAVAKACPEAAQAPDRRGADPFWHACEGASSSCAAFLADSCRLDAVYPDGSTPVHMAAKLPRADALRTLASRGARFDTLDERGRTALHCAAFGGSWLCAALAIASGCPLDAFDFDGMDAYSTATSMGHGQAAAAILAAMEAAELASQSEGRSEGSSSRSWL